MNRIYVILIVSLICAPGVISAQLKEPAMIRVLYEMTHIQDLDRPDNPHIEEMLLVAGPSAAIFTSYDRILQGISIDQQREEQKLMHTGPGFPMYRVSYSKAVDPVDFFFFRGEQKFFVIENLVINYMYEEDYPTIVWEIQPDTMSIRGVPCQKATGRFKGRDWSVWFSESIAMPFGPWALGGLPGLILEARDATGEVTFTFSGLEIVDPIDETAAETEDEESMDQVFNPGYVKEIEESKFYETQWIALPTVKVQKAKKQDVARLKEVAIKNPRQFFLTQLQATQGFVHNENISTNSWGRRIKNPIALDN